MFISIGLSIITGIFSIRNLYLCSPYYEKNYIQLCSWILSFYANAQVGIGTTKPKSTLDVNGKTTLRKELRVGGTSSTIGSAGLNGQVLVSQGEGKSPVWKSINVPFMEEGQYKLINSYLSSDQTGILTLTNGIQGDGTSRNSVGDDINDAAKANG
jgi:hypothetical protein